MSDSPAANENLSPLKQAFLALERTQARLASLEGALHEPIALVGAGCRMPGGANTPEAFWELLASGRDAITEVPPNRWDGPALYDPDPAAPGKMVSLEGGFLDEVERFDARFFGISPREALSLDPQQRLLLEVAYEAFEDAAMAPDRLAGTPGGVYVGICGIDYSKRITRRDPKLIDAYIGSGNAHSVAAGRLSYFFGLQGPSVAIDTACSSSLVALHWACQALRGRECDFALAGGVNLLLDPELSINFSKARMLSPDGRCKTFDASADGYVRGEGAAMVVLKRLSDALAAGDRILALVRGSAVNQDGPSSGLTVPNGPAQQEVIRRALADARLAADEIGYLEAHGTGTSLGDPIEMIALGEVFRGRTAPLAVGSVKTNIGHTEATAGVAGVLKAVFALKHGQIPPHLHFHEPSPRIPWNTLPLRVPTQLEDWPRGEQPRRAGVSAFAFNGTNAHVVLEEPPALDEADVRPERPSHLLPISAESPAALRELAARYAARIDEADAPRLADACYTAATGRSHLSHRLAVWAATPSEASQRLHAFCGGDPGPEVASGEVDANPPAVAFLFSGQGSQYAGMARQLDETEPTFRAALDACAEILRSHCDRPLREVLYPDDPASPWIHETAYTQPALFALEYALGRMWRSWGVQPAAMIGHSVGEYPAACLAGVFSLDDGLKLIAARGRLMQQLPRDGLMAAVSADEARVRAAIAGENEADVAAVNGPRQVVISGKAAAVERIVAKLEAEGVAARPLRVSHAFHSPLMEPMLAEFREVAQSVAFSRPQVKLVSNLTGRAVDEEIAQPEYWVRHVREAVRFADGVAALAAEGIGAALEIGPQSTLVNLARTCWPTGAETPHPRWLASLHPRQADWQSVPASLAELYVAGLEIDWRGFWRGFAGRKVRVPTYPFQRERFWLEPMALGGGSAPAGTGRTVHPLLGRRQHLAANRDVVLFEGSMRSSEPGYLQDHRIFETVVFPGTGFLEMAVAAGRQVLGQVPVTVEDVIFRRAITLPGDQPSVVQVVLTPDGDGHRCELFSRPAGDDAAPWTEHARGRIAPENGVGGREHPSGQTQQAASLTPGPSPASGRGEELVGIQTHCSQEVPVAGLYERLNREALHYGPCFRGLKRMFRNGREVLGKIELPEGHRREADEYLLHPALLDTCLHAMAGIVSDEETAQGGAPPFLPVGLKRLRLLAPAGAEVWSYAKVNGDGDFSKAVSFTADLRLFRPDGQAVAVLEELRMQRVPRATLMAAAGAGETSSTDWLYELAWRESASAAPSTSQADVWVLLADRAGLADALARRLLDAGLRCVVVLPGGQYTWHGAVADQPLRAAVREASPDDFARLFTELPERLGLRGRAAPNVGLVHLESLDAADDAGEAFGASHARLCGSVLHLVQAVADGNFPARLWLVTRGAQRLGDSALSPDALAQAPLWGLGRVIAVEHPELRATRVDLDPDADRDAQLDAIWDELDHPDAEDQVAYRGGKRHAARLVRVTQSDRPGLALPDGPYRLQLTAMGTPEGIQAVAGPAPAPVADEVQIEVAQAGLNFRDLLRSLGMLQEFEKTIGRRMGYTSALEAPLGFECAGRVTAVGEGVKTLAVGDEVLAIAYGSLASHVTTPARLAVRKPPALDMAQAATLPMACVTAGYALEHLARLQPGERVLIHAAAGGVGQAAVQLAQALGAEVFATASPGKWDLLRAQGVAHVMNSRTTEFRDEVLRITGGRGVDVVLNSLGGEFIPATLDTLAPGGRFVEIGLLGMWEPERVAAEYPHVTYYTLDIDREETLRPGSTQEILGRTVERIAGGALRPLPHRVVPVERIVEGLRQLNDPQRVGKIVVAVSAEERTGGRRKATIRGDAAYLVTGGLGGLGLEVARWLVKQGAGRVVLAGRRGAATSEQVAAVRELQQTGTEVEAVPADVARRDDVERLLAACRAGGRPLAGVFHAAGVLDDGALRMQTPERFDRVMRPKVAGAWHLHELAQDLELFVLFSSGVGLVGAHGQGNYAAANAFLDALAHFRHSRHQPAVSIAWGPWDALGMTVRMDPRARARMAQIGLKTIGRDEGLAMLARVLDDDRPHVAPLEIDWPTLASAIPPSPFWAELASGPEPEAGDGSAFLEALRAAPAGDRKEMLVAQLRGEVAAVLGWGSAEQVGRRQKLFDLGMDSLTSVELRHRLERSLACSLPLTVVFDYPSVEALAQFIGQQLALPEEEPAPAAVDAIAADDPDARHVASLTDDEVERMMAEKFKELLDG